MSRDRGRRGIVAASLAALVASLALCACARARPPPVVSAAAGAADAGLPGVAAAGELDAARADAAWARRDEPGALDDAALLWERASSTADAPERFLLRAAQARRARGEELAARAGESAADAAPGATARDLLAASARESAACAADARRAWSRRYPAAAASLETGAPTAAFLLVAAPGAEALYLDALCAAAWARAQGFTQLIERHAELEAELARAAALVPALDDGGPDRELGKLLAALPAYAGGNLRDARGHFEAALAQAPASIVTRVLFARSVAIKQQDRALFETLLNAALAPAAATPGERLAQADARALLSHEDELFGALP